MTDSQVGCTIDFDRPGKQIGHLSLPKITNTAGWASTFVHLAQIANGDARPGHLSGSRIGVRTAVVVTLVICTEGG